MESIVAGQKDRRGRAVGLGDHPKALATRNLRDAFERLILPRLGSDTLLAALTWEDVDRWHRLLGEATPTQANRALAALRKALNVAKQWSWLERGAPNPATDHEMHPERKAGRPFSPAELRAIGAALRKEPVPVIRAAATVFLLTGLRPSEVYSLRWRTSAPAESSILRRRRPESGAPCCRPGRRRF